MAKTEWAKTRRNNVKRNGAKNKKWEIEADSAWVLKIMEQAISDQIYAETKEENEEIITNGEWEMGKQWRPQTEKRAQMGEERRKSPLTEYLENGSRPSKTHLEEQITERER